MERRVDDDTRFRILRILEANPEASQREIAAELNVSLGMVNYCVKALVLKGLVKVQNFRASTNKLRYAYILTPQGLSDKARLTRSFLARRIAEFEALEAEIEELRQALPNAAEKQAETGE